MNNNNNKNTGKESDIITKKGFLISLPGKKKEMPEGASSINLAKPQAQAQKKQDSDSDNREKNNKKNHEWKNRNKHDKEKDKNRHGSEAVRADRTDNRPDRKNKDNHRKDNKNIVNDSQANMKKEKPEQNRDSAGKQVQNTEKRDRNDRNDRNRHGKKNRHGDKNQNRNNQQNEKQLQNQGGNRDTRAERKDASRYDAAKTKAAPLSALSGDIAKEINLHSEKKAGTAVVSELSLEEKYKNAKPLREQIAEQEMRQKGIKIPYDTNEVPAESEKQEIVGIRFREAGKIYYFDPAGVKVPFGSPVIVETARGSEYGFCAISNRTVPVDSLTAPLKKLERLATPIDTQKHEANKMLEKDAEKVFIEKVEKLGLAMNLIYVEYTFDNSRLLFYFTAETRIDFRELVKELAGVFRTRIELRQIGVRDEAKMLGGLGVCGRATCCNTFLGDFAQVSIKMAKDQSLSLNAAKISGACGKLMCCLRYEDKVYEEENARTPKVGSIVETAEGKGVVVERNALKGIVNVQLELTPEAPAKPFPREEVMVVGFNKSKSDDDIDAEELKHLQDS